VLRDTSSHREAHPRTPPDENRWVAIVDDDPSVRSALARVLRTAGITVETYATAHEYLSASIDREPSCLVLDVHLGGMTGSTCTTGCSHRDPPSACCSLTAHDDVPTSPSSNAEPAPDGYLRKPFDGDQLLALVRRILADRLGEVGCHSERSAKGAEARNPWRSPGERPARQGEQGILAPLGNDTKLEGP
jgi:FixJ family two-component response regulator